MASSGPAVDWAAQQQPGGNLRWRQFEAAAWSGHETVTRAFDGKPPRGVGIAGGAAMIAFIVMLLSPVLALAFALDADGVVIGRFMSSNDGLADATRVHGSALFLAITVVPLLVGAVVWLRGERARRGTMVGGYAIFAVVAAAISSITMIGLRDRVSDWAPYVIPPVVVIVLGIAIVVMTMVLATSDELNEQGPVYANRTAVVAAIAELTEAQRAEVRADLEAALDDLRTRGVITSREREKVRAAPLGLLTRTLTAPRGGGTSVD